MKTADLIREHLTTCCADGRAFAATLPEDPYAALDHCETLARASTVDDTRELLLIRCAAYDLKIVGEAEFDDAGMLVKWTTPAGRLFKPENDGELEASCSVATLRAVNLLRTWLEGKVKR